MRRAIIRVVIEDETELDALYVKAQIESLVEEMDKATVEMTLTTVPERPSV